jgi:3-oxoadipate enol-lactonase
VIDAITAVTLSGQVRTETLAAFARISTEGFTAAVRCLPTNDVRDQLAVISHPALVVVGELDTETPPAYAKTLADGLPNSELHVLPGVGHLSPAEAPDAFNELVASFLSTDQPARTSR